MLRSSDQIHRVRCVCEKKKKKRYSIVKIDTRLFKAHLYVIIYDKYIVYLAKNIVFPVFPFINCIRGTSTKIYHIKICYNVRV